MIDNGKIRVSSTGATRDSSVSKMEIVKYMSPLVVEAFGKYMLKHQIQSDGSKREGDNWKKGFGTTHKETQDICFDSLGRHFLDLWMEHDGFKSRDGIDEAFGGLFFNICGYWDSLLKERLENENK